MATLFILSWQTTGVVAIAAFIAIEMRKSAVVFCPDASTRIGRCGKAAVALPNRDAYRQR
jgi:hypothetical protein